MGNYPLILILFQLPEVYHAQDSCHYRFDCISCIGVTVSVLRQNSLVRQLLGEVHAGAGSRHQRGTASEHRGGLSGIRSTDNPAGAHGAAECGAVRQHGSEHHWPARGDLREGSRHVHAPGESDFTASDFARRSVGNGRDIPEHLRRIGQDGLSDDSAAG